MRHWENKARNLAPYEVAQFNLRDSNSNQIEEVFKNLLNFFFGEMQLNGILWTLVN